MTRLRAGGPSGGEDPPNFRPPQTPRPPIFECQTRHFFSPIYTSIFQNFLDKNQDKWPVSRNLNMFVQKCNDYWAIFRIFFQVFWPWCSKCLFLTPWFAIFDIFTPLFRPPDPPFSTFFKFDPPNPPNPPTPQNWRTKNMGGHRPPIDPPTPQICNQWPPPEVWTGPSDLCENAVIYCSTNSRKKRETDSNSLLTRIMIQITKYLESQLPATWCLKTNASGY